MCETKKFRIGTYMDLISQYGVKQFLLTFMSIMRGKIRDMLLFKEALF